MTEAEEHTWGTPPPYAPFPEEDNFWGSTFAPNTQHLPDEVVGTEFSMVIVSRTSREDSRYGMLQIALQFGERENPRDLTPQEATYVREVMMVAMRLLTKGQVT